jgi:hypothetical protein
VVYFGAETILPKKFHIGGSNLTITNLINDWFFKCIREVEAFKLSAEISGPVVQAEELDQKRVSYYLEAIKRKIILSVYHDKDVKLPVPDGILVAVQREDLLRVVLNLKNKRRVAEAGASLPGGASVPP